MEHSMDNIFTADNMDLHGHPAAGAGLDSVSEEAANTGNGELDQPDDLSKAQMGEAIRRGAELYCELLQQFTGSAVQKTAAHIGRRLSEGSMAQCMHFFYKFLGSVVFRLLEDDLSTLATTRRRQADRQSGAGAKTWEYWLLQIGGGRDAEVLHGATQGSENAFKRELMHAFCDLVGRKTMGGTVFECRLSYRQVLEGILETPCAGLAAYIYTWIYDPELECWSRILHEHDMEQFWLPR